jgi:glycerol kinase
MNRTKKQILAIDQGTTSSRSIIIDSYGKVVSKAQHEFKQYYPKAGWVEHDPFDIWYSQLKSINEVIADSGDEDVAAIGITNQRETTIICDRSTGEPVYNAIVWQDRRTADYCQELKNKQKNELIRSKTGLIIDPYFSATKIRWILENVDGMRQKAVDGLLAFGTVDSWLIWNLTQGKIHATDVSNASRTMLFNIHNLDWDAELLDLFEIPREILPQVKSSSELYGYAHINSRSIPIAGIAGDQQAALFGQLCTKPGMVKNTYGTGAFLVLNTGETPVISQNNLLTTIGYQIGEKVIYALEGSIFMAGAVVQWLRDEISLIKSSAEIEPLAAQVPDNGGVYIVPAFTGLGAPHWSPDARGTIFGLTRGSGRPQIARAALEAIAFQVADIIQAMKIDSGISISELRVDGGASANNLLMQFQADMLNIPVIRPQITETTAFGAAYLAGLAVNVWQSVDELQRQWAIDTKFERKLNVSTVDDLYDRWQKAVESTKEFYSQ